MNEELIAKLEDLERTLEYADEWKNNQVLIDANTKINFYLAKLNKDNDYYKSLLKDLKLQPVTADEYRTSLWKLKSVVSTLLEDLNLSENGQTVNSEQQRNKMLAELQNQIEAQKEKIESDVHFVTKAKGEIQREREELYAEQEKFNNFKTKLEVADKSVDFQINASNNKRNASVWIWIAATEVLGLMLLLFFSLDSNDNFINIATDINAQLHQNQKIIDNVAITTLYFSFAKYIFTKLLFYSIIIYSILICIKNYNAQMHNHVINAHKANAFKSTLSILDTAKSDEGNDKILVQATQAIFSHQNTGYQKSDSDNSPNVVTNVIESVAKKI
jgi:hypothetical protein